MRAAGRAAVASTATIAALYLGASAISLARGDAIVARVGEILEGPVRGAKTPTFETWLQVRNDLLEARRLTPGDPTVLESLGVLHARRGQSPELLTYARDYFQQALVLRPTSPYAWANLANTMYRLRPEGAGLEQPLDNAIRFGPWEPAVHRLGTDLGLAAYGKISPESRDEVRKLIGNSMHRNPIETLQIAERRDRLDVACAFTPGNRRVDVHWIERCKATEQQNRSSGHS
jgi:hypothetical protein